MTKIVLTASALLLVGASAFAPSATAKAAPKAAKAAPLVCPVTGDEIASVKDAVGSSTYKGKTYYFCCPSCKPQFDKNPAKYAKTASAATPAKPGATHKM